MDTLIEKAGILSEALPYIRNLSGKTVVIKYGGNAMTDSNIIDTILQDITLLKYVGVNPVVVHGGGPEINKTLSKLDIHSEFVNGLRVTDAATMEVVQMVLTGKINKDIVSKLCSLGAQAIGLCGKDAKLIQCEKQPPVNNIDLGYVGEIKKINVPLLSLLTQGEYIPVIAPIGTGIHGESYNINADTVAGAVAVALKAEKLIFLTDIDGVRLNPNDPSTLLSTATCAEVERLIKEGIVSGGMIPKLTGCMEAIKQGIAKAHILDGRIPHPLLLEIFTDKGIGTMITA
jgi:acetylglutamate kinase